MIIYYKDELVIKNYLKIIFLDENILKVEFKDFIINIHGDNLQILYFYDKEIILKGNINKVIKI